MLTPARLVVAKLEARRVAGRHLEVPLRRRTEGVVEQFEV